MKYFLRVVLVLAFAVALVFGVYTYTESKNKDLSSNGNSQLTTVTKQPATEKDSDRILLNSIDENGERFDLYQRGRQTIVLHNGKKEYIFDDWSKFITVEKPEMHYRDYDYDNKEKTMELAIKVVSSKNVETGECIYDIYLLNFFKDENGEEQVDLNVAGERDWKRVLENSINIELSQPSYCPKFVQVAMAYRWRADGIKYDDDGVAESLYQKYSHALRDGKGGYLKTSRWSFGQAEYSFDEENYIQVKVDVLVHYQDSDAVQNLGQLCLQMFLNKSNVFACREKTMHFEPNPAYRSLSPKNKTRIQWKYTETNTDKSDPSGNDKIIDWLKYKFSYDSTVDSNSVSYANLDTEIKNISKLEFTSKGIKLYAKKGCSFSSAPIQTGDFKVVINEGQGDDEYEIAYKAKISKQKDIEVLDIQFENDYPQRYYRTVTVYYNTQS